MASGFIKMQDGNSWYARWTGYDFLLESIMLELESAGKAGELKKWLQSILPDEQRGDIECGWCFIKMPEEKSVVRIIDTRFIRKEYLAIFWDTVFYLKNKLTNDEDGTLNFLMNDLWQLYEESLKKEYIEPPPFNSQTEDIEDRQLGPGWN